ncbi:MAG: hypothetical protein PSW75_03645 [bacterium]|nr:hypothetical protein [bacterium]MDI1335416.1 hypothetical protein [Lacunisphaera sp.]
MPPIAPDRRPVLLLAALTVLGWMACAVWPRVLSKLGITDYGQWFLDSYAVLASNDAVRAGLSPDADNPLDPLLRSHKYSDWWLGLRWLGLTRAENFFVGLAWVGAFAVTAWQTLKPRNFRETALAAALLLSPPVLLGVNRANNDLVIFVLLALAGVAAAGTTWMRQALAWGALALATALKFYPVTAAAGFFLVRPVRRMPLALLGALLAAGLALTSVWPQMGRGVFPIATGLHTLGAALLWRDLGWSDEAARYGGLLVLAVGAAVLVRCRCTTGLATRGALKERLSAALGVIVLLACFLAGVSFVYRWIFALWMALWLWRRAGEPTEDGRAHRAFRVGAGLMLFCFWGNGILCLVVNLLLLPMAQARLDALVIAWRWGTQSLHWVLMIMLAGWLLEAAIATGTEWREATRTRPST